MVNRRIPMMTIAARLLRPAALLRLEGAAILVAALSSYRQLGANWLLFALLLLFPDIAAVGYLAGGRLGVACYNAMHTLTLPALLLLFGLLTGTPLALAIAAIWFAHIGLDRVLGYGLKEVGPVAHVAPRPVASSRPVTR
jgi:hypothetical protein